MYKIGDIFEVTMFDNDKELYILSAINDNEYKLVCVLSSNKDEDVSGCYWGESVEVFMNSPEGKLEKGIKDILDVAWVKSWRKVNGYFDFIEE